jgi:hypothetical protein
MKLRDLNFIFAVFRFAAERSYTGTTFQTLEFELRCRCPRPTESEHGAIFRLRAHQAEARMAEVLNRGMEAELLPWKACIPVMQE